MKELFSKKYARFIFNFIAKIYSFILDKVSLHSLKAAKYIKDNFGLENKKVLDIGTGRGDWAYSLHKLGGKVKGIDFAKNMIKEAKKKYGDNIEFSVMDGENLENIENNSYDIVTSAFVLHGMKIENREIVLKEMKRIGKNIVIVKDFGGKESIFMKFLEIMERSDYFNFIKTFEAEMNKIFIKTKRVFIPSDKSTLYIGYINKEG